METESRRAVTAVGFFCFFLFLFGAVFSAFGGVAQSFVNVIEHLFILVLAIKVLQELIHQSPPPANKITGHMGRHDHVFPIP